MTTRYVGIGGNDGWDGLAWVSRKLTLTGAEDTPVAATDVVYVGPGVYREVLTVDISGAAGQPITYIGDVTGEHTDGIGGIVRITGSNDDMVGVRANCITSTTKHYRTFQNFMLDTATAICVTLLVSCTDWIITDCTFLPGGSHSIADDGLTQARLTVRRCVFFSGYSYAINLSHVAVVDNATHLIENCLMLNGQRGFSTTRVGGIIIKNCLFTGLSSTAIRVATALTVGQTITVNNCIFEGVISVLTGTVAGEIVEDYNTFFGNGTNRTLTNVGANSVTYPALYNPFIKLAGFRYPSFVPMELSMWSQVRAKLGSAEATDDLLGMTRPVTAAKDSWGAIQYADALRSIVQAHGGVASIQFVDAGRKQFIIPTTAINTTFSVYVYREANYAGVNPQMVIKQPNVADTTVLDAGAVGGWNLLTTALVPAALPPYVIVELVSNNTAVAGNYNTYFDDLTVS